MIFKLKADAEFEADDIDDAFSKLETHFKVLGEGEDSDLLIGGSIEIEPLGEERKEA